MDCDTAAFILNELMLITPRSSHRFPRASAVVYMDQVLFALNLGSGFFVTVSKSQKCVWKSTTKTKQTQTKQQWGLGFSVVCTCTHNANHLYLLLGSQYITGPKSRPWPQRKRRSVSMGTEVVEIRLITHSYG